jgi:phenylpyruvate tautomerase PptA (4-oxalocrotonate tautomerase family)
MNDSARSPHDICGPVAESPILTEVQQGRTSMPLWHIYCPEKAYSAEDKCAFATRITDLYAEVGLPRFYVSVVFHELSKDSFFIGGEPTNDFVRIWIDYIARSPSPERRQWWLETINNMLNPFVRDRDYRWEIHIDQTPIDFWNVQGMKPPDAGSEAEKRWVKENRPSAYTGVSI